MRRQAGEQTTACSPHQGGSRTQLCCSVVTVSVTVTGRVPLRTRRCMLGHGQAVGWALLNHVSWREWNKGKANTMLQVEKLQDSEPNSLVPKHVVPLHDERRHLNGLQLHDGQPPLERVRE